jgi:alanine racemase
MQMIAQHGTLEISRSRLRHNLAALRERLGPETKICATIKANAYGHGVREMAGLLRNELVEWACVYSLTEAEELAGQWEPLLVLAPLVLGEGGDLDGRMLELLSRVRVNVTDVESARQLGRIIGKRRERRVRVHIQVDSGLTRAGARPGEAGAIAEAIAECEGLELEGVFGHFSHGDVAGHETVVRQVGMLRSVAEQLKRRWPGLLVHAQNSGGAWHLRNSGLDLARVGIAMYGLQPGATEGKDRVPGILPIARLVAPVLAIHERPAGMGVGYGHTFVTTRASRLAIVPVGYGDGYPRAMSNPGLAGVVEICGVDAPVVGRVSMDQIVVDVTDVQEVRVGERVTVISWEPGAANSVDEMAGRLGTIGYEIATGFGARLQRLVVE